jgi:hypothetical protein
VDVAILTVTSDTGGTTKPVGALYVPPERVRVDAGAGTTLYDSGLDPVFTADLLSAMLMHERCGVHLYRSVAGRTLDPEAKAAYELFGQQTLRHVEILEQLISSTGGDIAYVSPAARATEKGNAGLLESTFMLDGSVDPATAELTMLEAVMLAESKDHGNWELLALVAENMDDGPVRDGMVDAVEIVLAEEEEHYGWAANTRTRLLYEQVVGRPLPEMGDEVRSEGTVDLAEATKEELYATAQELDIPGRSAMTKEELAAAIEEQA